MYIYIHSILQFFCDEGIRDIMWLSSVFDAITPNHDLLITKDSLHFSTRQEKDTSIMCPYAPLDNISAH